VRATDLVAEEVHHLTDLALHEKEEQETNGYQIEEIQTGEKTSIPTYPQQVGEPRDHEVVHLVATAGAHVVPSTEAETILIPAGRDLLHDDSPQDEMGVQHLLQDGARALHTAVDLSVPL
jgi:hypothetical protein